MRRFENYNNNSVCIIQLPHYFVLATVDDVKVLYVFVTSSSISFIMLIILLCCLSVSVISLLKKVWLIPFIPNEMYDSFGHKYKPY
jgi:hypothetical protein